MHGSRPHRCRLLRAIPLCAEVQYPSRRLSNPISERPTLPKLGQPRQPGHNRRRHYPHKRAAPPSQTFPRFPPLRLLGRLPPECMASSISGRRPRSLNRNRLRPDHTGPQPRSVKVPRLWRPYFALPEKMILAQTQAGVGCTRLAVRKMPMRSRRASWPASRRPVRFCNEIQRELT